MNCSFCANAPSAQRPIPRLTAAVAITLSLLRYMRYLPADRLLSPGNPLGSGLLQQDLTVAFDPLGRKPSNEDLVIVGLSAGTARGGASPCRSARAEQGPGAPRSGPTPSAPPQ